MKIRVLVSMMQAIWVLFLLMPLAWGQERLPSGGTEAGAANEGLTEAELDKALRELGGRVDTLKEDSFTTKSRLLLLREEVLRRSVSGARLRIVHKNAMGKQYNLIQMQYTLGNEPKFMRQDDSGRLNELDEELIFEGMVAPGKHTLYVTFIYRGNTLGLFRYMTGYSFRVSSGYSFVLDEGKSAELVVTAAERGNFFTAYEERPDIRFQLEQVDLVANPESSTADPRDTKVEKDAKLEKAE